MTDLAPIALFTFTRLDTLKKVVESLKRNPLAAASEIYIFSDAGRKPLENKAVELVRDYLKTITGFKNVHLNFSPANMGLAKSIITGVTGIVNEFGKVIVLEDDLIVSSNFLNFMNQGLDFYKKAHAVFSISGFSFPDLASPKYQWDAYFIPRGLSWGWATWKDRWQKVDWDIKDFASFSNNPVEIEKFNQGGTDLFPMLKKQMEGNLDSWAIRWFYNQYKLGGLTAYPKTSKVLNEGFDAHATHTNVYNRYKTYLDISEIDNFVFPTIVETNSAILKRFQKNYSVFTRIFWGRIMTIFQKIVRKIFK